MEPTRLRLRSSSNAESKWRAFLGPYLPSRALAEGAHLLSFHDIELRLSRPRKTRIGDYREPDSAGFHRISMNLGIDRGRFLWTLVHELAHLRVFERHGRHAQAHGKLWKEEFRHLMIPFVREDVYPLEFLPNMLRHLENPKATVQSDAALFRSFREMSGSTAAQLLDEISLGEAFRLKDGRRFIKLQERRTRVLCESLPDGRRYLIHKSAEVST